MSNRLRNLSEPGALEEALRAEVSVLYKHSPFCAMSMGAMRQIKRFVERNPETPLYMIDVIDDRDLSQRLSKDLNVRHESPQAILLRAGTAQHHASHHEVTVDMLERWLSETT